MKLLSIEASSEFLSLAVSNGSEVFSYHERAGQRHAEIIFGEIGQLLRRADMTLAELQGIAFGCGPGSFTGLRIACGVTQGLAFALDLPVKGVVTLKAMAEEAYRMHGAERVIACIDARMGEVYHAAYQRDAGRWSETCPPGLYLPGDVPRPDGSGWTGCGTGFSAHADVLCGRYPEVLPLQPTIVPSAWAELALAAPAFESGAADSVEQALPYYIRDKVALKKREQG